VGDVKTPLLGIVNRKTSMKHPYNTLEHAAFNFLQYIPLQKKYFDTVTIQFMTDFGEPMPFIAGKLFVVLEFHRMVHPYLLL